MDPFVDGLTRWRPQTLFRVHFWKYALLWRYLLRLELKLQLAMDPTGPVRGRIRDPVADTVLWARLRLFVPYSRALKVRLRERDPRHGYRQDALRQNLLIAASSAKRSALSTPSIGRCWSWRYSAHST